MSQQIIGEMPKFTCQQCGGCCGPVPLFKSELKAIRTAIWPMSQIKREQIQAQKRDQLTCILLDVESKRCSVYGARPLVCRQFGQIRELQCPNNQGLSLKSGLKETEDKLKFDSFAGILSEDIGWKELEE